MQRVLVQNDDSSLFINQVFKVQELGPIQATQLIFTIASDWEPDPNFPNDPAAGDAYIDRTFHALGIDGGTATTCEGNRVFNCEKAGTYHDTWDSRDLIVRNNFYSNVMRGVIQNIGGVGSPVENLSLTYAFESGEYIATATNAGSISHGLLKGDGVYIDSTQPNTPQYHGYFTVIEIHNAYTFKYRLPSNPNASSSGQWRRLWRVRQIIIEKNVIELALAVSDFGPPTAIGFLNGKTIIPYTPTETHTGEPYLFNQVVVRGNVVRYVNNQLEPLAHRSRGAVFNSVENLIIEKNFFDLAPHAYNLLAQDIKQWKAFANQRPDGQRILLYNGDVNVSAFRPEFGQSEVEDSIILSLL